VRNHTRVVGLTAVAQGWRVRLQDSFSGMEHEVIAKSVVNAAGVWVDALRSLALGSPGQHDGCPPLVRASQGVHLVVSRDVLPLSEAVLVPRTSDERVLFAVPWLGATVIGTTDTPRDDAPMEPRPMAQELAFLFDETRRFLGVSLTPADVRSVWVGLRPLVGSGEADNTAGLSREHVVLQEAPGFLTVTGGKWTTYRAMAEEVMAALVDAGDLPAATREAHTDRQALHGAASSGDRPVSLTAPPGLHLFGTEATHLAQAPGAELSLGLGLTEAMVRFCARQEWTVTVEDMLARRWRVLFLDARLAEQMAPAVAQLLQDETGLDPQLAGFLALCKQYRLTD
jgi:glycerol-3-phosphate dehydrogenase